MMGIFMTTDTSALQTAFSTAVTSVKSDVFTFMGLALPVALGIVGAIMAVKFGIKFFKSVTKG
jgi:hypothetical protein